MPEILPQADATSRNGAGARTLVEEIGGDHRPQDCLLFASADAVGEPPQGALLDRAGNSCPDSRSDARLPSPGWWPTSRTAPWVAGQPEAAIRSGTPASGPIRRLVS